MNIKSLVFGATIVFAAVFFGGCAYAPTGGHSGGYRFIFPQNGIIVVNNTSAIIDVEIDGHLVKKDLAPGDTLRLERWSFSDGEAVIIVAKGHTAENEYIGMAAREFRMTSGYGGRQHQSIIMVVDHLRGPGGSSYYR